MLIIVLLKIFTCWWTVLQENINFQSTWFIAVVIAFTSALLKSQAKRPYGGGYTILRLSLQYIIWWWQFSCSVGWIALSTTKLRWSVKIRSMQDSEFRNKWVVSDISWWKPWVEIKESNLVSSVVVESTDHHYFDRTLKLTKMTIKAGWKIWTWSKSFSKFDKKSSNWELVWLGER